MIARIEAGAARGKGRGARVAGANVAAEATALSATADAAIVVVEARRVEGGVEQREGFLFGSHDG